MNIKKIFIMLLIYKTFILNANVYQSMNTSIKDKEFVGQLYACMNITNKILSDNNITYWTCGGALLGAIRHGGFIPWDFDIDLEVNSADFKKILTLKETFLKHGMYFGQNIQNIFIRIHHDYVNSEGKKKTVFIEFYETYKSGDTIKLKLSLLYTSYKESYWFASDLENIHKVPFGPIFLAIPDNPEAHLKRYYGDDVLHKANGKHTDVTVFAPAEYIWPSDADTTIYT